MYETYSNSSSDYHPLFHKKEVSTETSTNLNIISSIWNYDCIERIDENKWNCIWFYNIFQGINYTKTLTRVLVKRGIHTTIFFPAIGKNYLTRC